MYGLHERCLGLNEKPVLVYGQLVSNGWLPTFELRPHVHHEGLDPKMIPVI